MTVLIKGMEMPNRCFECIFLTTVPNFFCLAGKRDLCAEHGINISRPDWCPLIEVQSPHGRLVDADVFKETIDYYIREANWSDAHNEALGWAKEFIDNEQAVIEAEGSEDG